MIFTALSPNTEADDIRRALGALAKPWSWKKGGAERELRSALEKRFSGAPVALFESGRTSLLAILRALGVTAGDEVLIQAYTCVAVPEPIIWAGARPVYVDCREDLTMDVADLERKITKRTRAIIVQHTFGTPADMDAIMALARSRSIPVIEDLAHALGATYQGREVGTIGDAAFGSFGRDKVVSAVFGGFAVASTRELAEKIEQVRAKLPYPSRAWIWRQLDHPIVMAIAKPLYGIFGIGKGIIEAAKRSGIISVAVERCERKGGQPSFAGRKMPNALALLALGQIRKLERYGEHRKRIAALYGEELTDSGIVSPWTNPNGSSAWLRYTILDADRDGLMRYAAEKGIILGDWYATPLAPDGVEYELVGYRRDCPNAERLARESINLPTGIQISEADARRVALIVREWKSSRSGVPLGLTAREIDEKAIWDGFIDAVAPSTFMHAWAWGEAERANGRSVSRFGIYRGDELIAAFMIVIVRARRGNLALCPHGPVISVEDRALTGAIIGAMRRVLSEIGARERCVVARVSPILIGSKAHGEAFRSEGFRRAPIHVYPELSWVLDISPDEETILAGMKKNTRYGIRKAERDGITIRSSADEADFDLFWRIYADTARRQSFVPHPERLVRAEFAEFVRDGRARIYFAYHKGEPISTAFIVYGADSAFYHHGASLPHTAITPGEALQWQVIRDARERGLKRYNFWGVVPEGKTDHAWARLDKFKRGFGGAEEAYVPTQDLPLSWRYALLYAVERVRRWRRRV